MTSTRSTVHRDGRVRVWDVYAQQWWTGHARDLRDDVIAALPQRDRARVIRAQAVRP